MLTPRRPRPGGFTMVEILAVIAIGIILAAAFLPVLIGSLDRSRVNESAESLQGIAEAVGNMWDDVARYPGRLSHLSAPIAANVPDLCGTTFGAPAVTAWNGPYLNRSVPATGLPLAIGVVRDSLGYSATPPLLRIDVDDVSHADARALDRKVDMDADSANGAVRWGPVSASGVVVLTYVRPVKSC